MSQVEDLSYHELSNRMEDLEREEERERRVEEFRINHHYIFETPSTPLPADIRFVDFGDRYVAPDDVTGTKEQLLQFTESTFRTFNHIATRQDHVPSPRRGIRVKTFPESGRILLDARSVEEFNEFSVSGSTNVPKYWDIDAIYDILWRYTSTSYTGELPIYIIGKHSALRATALYRNIVLMDRLLSGSNLRYPEIYIVDGGTHAIRPSGRNGGSAAEKLAYYNSSGVTIPELEVLRNPFLSSSPAFFSSLIERESQ